MATESTEISDDATERSSSPTDDASAQQRAQSLLPAGRYGRLAMAAGGVVLLRTLFGRSGSRGRAIAKAALGTGLIVLGLRQRSASSDASFGAAGTAVSDEEATEPPGHSTGIHTPDRRADSNEPGHNPRDVDDDPDVATASDPEEGRVQFSTGDDEDPEQKPHLDPDDPMDPRFADDNDPETSEDTVEVDISEAAMADEPNEAVGPTSEQAYPASEGTDPEPTSPEAPEAVNEGAVAPAGDDESADTGATDEEEMDEEPADEESMDEEMADDEATDEESTDDEN